MESQQEEVYEAIGATAIEQMRNGFNSTVLAYGQVRSRTRCRLWRPGREGRSRCILGNSLARGSWPAECVAVRHAKESGKYTYSY